MMALKCKSQQKKSLNITTKEEKEVENRRRIFAVYRKTGLNHQLMLNFRNSDVLDCSDIEQRSSRC